MHSLPAKILMPVIQKVILYGKLRVKPAMGKKIVLCLKKEMALLKESPVLLGKVKSGTTSLIGF